MHPVFQEIKEMATAKLREALNQDQEEAQSEGWDLDACEQQVGQFTRHGFDKLTM